MILSWEMFLRGNAQRFRMTLLNLPKKSYPSSVDGLVRMGLNQDLADSLKARIEQLGLAERIGVCLFVEAYARCERMDDYVGKVALERYLVRLRIDCELRKTFLKWTKGALAAANTPSKKRSA